MDPGGVGAVGQLQEVHAEGGGVGTSSVPIGAEHRPWWADFLVIRTNPEEPVMEARSAQQGGVRAPSAGSGRDGACWGPRTNQAVLMLGPPDRGGLGPAERMRRS